MHSRTGAPTGGARDRQYRLPTAHRDEHRPVPSAPAPDRASRRSDRAARRGSYGDGAALDFDAPPAYNECEHPTSAADLNAARHDFAARPVHIGHGHANTLTQPRMAEANPLHGTADELAPAEHTAAPLACARQITEFWLNPAYLHEESSSSEEIRMHPIAPDSGRSGIDLLKKAVLAAWNSTEGQQGFYGAEFSHAQERAVRPPEPPEDATLREILETRFQPLRVSAGKGTDVRTLRDMMSLVVSVPIVVGVGMQMANDTSADSPLGFDSFRHADLPYGSEAAAYALMAGELLKAPGTAALSYPTVASHHMVDDLLARLESTLKLADVLFNGQGLEGTTGLTALSRTSRGAAMACLGAGEMARHLSTVFTLLNYLIAPARVGLFAHNELAGPAQLDQPDWMHPLTGLLRFTSSMSDTIRALLSQIGTHCRHERFALRMEALLDSAEYLSLRVRATQNDALSSARIDKALLQLRILCTYASNEVLDLLARDRVARSEALRALTSNDPLRVCRRIGRNLEPFGVHVSSIYGEGAAGLSLRLQPRQNNWGRVTGTQGNWWDHAQFPLRMSYRLTLMLQRLLTGMLNRVCEPCTRPPRPHLQR